MKILDKFFICNILFVIFSWKMCYELTINDSLEKIFNIIKIIDICLIVFDIIYIILKVVLKISKDVNRFYLINKNNDD